MSLSNATVEVVDRLITASARKIELLTELRDMLLVSAAVGVPVEDVKSSGFRSPTSAQYKRWSREARARLPWFSTFGYNSACHYRGNRIVTKVLLRDGTDMELTEPIFLPGAPEPPASYFQRLGREKLLREGNKHPSLSEIMEEAERIRTERKVDRCPLCKHSVAE